MLGDIILDLLAMAFVACVISCWVYALTPESKDEE